MRKYVFLEKIGKNENRWFIKIVSLWVVFYFYNYGIMFLYNIKNFMLIRYLKEKYLIKGVLYIVIILKNLSIKYVFFYIFIFKGRFRLDFFYW